MVFKLAVKNVFSRKSSFVIVLFISLAVCLFSVANAFFDSTEKGVRNTFVSSFTGDIFIRPKNNTQLSLFGDETPVTGELTSIDSLIPYDDISAYLQTSKNIEGFAPQITCMTAMEYGKKRLPVYTFGIDASNYLSIMKAIHIIDGKVFDSDEKGVMVCNTIANRLGVTVGDTVQFTVADGPNFRIRAATVTAIYEYDVFNSIFDRFVLLNSNVVRSLLDLDTGIDEDVVINPEDMNLLEEDLDFDSLFEEDFDFDKLDNYIYDESEYKIELTSDNNDYVVSESTIWNFIIIRLKDGINTKLAIKKLNKTFKKNGWPVLAADWRHGAGSTALYLYWMRIIFNIGIGIILVAGLIIVNNTLVVNILDRTQEIGTLRAIGTRKLKISIECMIENFIITIMSGVIGIVLAKIGCWYISNAHIIFNNSFLIQLFGSDALYVYVSSKNILNMFILVLVIGIIGWIYPVINAVRITPVTAMQGAR